MTTALLALIAIQLPSFDMLLICLFGAVLPGIFFLWLSSWLGSIQEEHPDHVISAQAKADKEHRNRHGGSQHAGHGHGH